MATVEDHVKLLEKVSNGQAMRQPLIDILNTLNNGVSGARNLRHNNITYPANEFLLRTTFEELTSYDHYPVDGSAHAVTSGGLYDIFLILNSILDDVVGNEEGDMYG